MKNTILASALLMTIISCGSNDDKVTIKDGEISSSDAIALAKQAGKEIEKAQDRWEERKAKGDTVAMAYKDLEAFLPDIEGYEKDGGPKGNQMTMPGMGSYSSAKQKYTSGDKRLTVEITDYNGAHMAFSGATALYRMNFSSEDDDKRQGSVDIGIPQAAAYETVHKDGSQAELSMIADDRFVVTIRSRGSNDMDVLKSAAGKIANGLINR